MQKSTRSVRAGARFVQMALCHRCIFSNVFASALDFSERFRAGVGLPGFSASALDSSGGLCVFSECFRVGVGFTSNLLKLSRQRWICQEVFVIALEFSSCRVGVGNSFHVDLGFVRFFPRRRCAFLKSIASA